MDRAQFKAMVARDAGVWAKLIREVGVMPS